MTTLRSTLFAALAVLLGGCSSASQDPSGPLPDQDWTVAGPGATSTTSADSQNASAADGGAAATGAATDPTSTGSTGSTASSGTAPAADAGTAAADDDASTVCVQSTDTGNADGVGKFCATATDCASGLVCSSAFNPPAGDTFCSKICTTDADCGGDGATCFTANGVSACVTAACAPVAAKLF